VPYVYNARAEDDAAVKRWLQSLDLVRASRACKIAAAQPRNADTHSLLTTASTRHVHQAFMIGNVDYPDVSLRSNSVTQVTRRTS